MTISHKTGTIDSKQELLERTIEILELKNTMTEIKNSLKGLISRFDLAKERFSRLEHSTVEIIQTKEQRGKKMKKNEQSQKNVGHHPAHQHICNWITRRRGERKEKKKYLKKL